MRLVPRHILLHFPTLAEANKYVAGNWKRAHAPAKVLEWLERLHAWRRG
ncbi:MAG: hypothetical protein ACRER2_17370 [Methylococcales bacterium]